MVYETTVSGMPAALCAGCVEFCFVELIPCQVLAGPVEGSCEECQAPAARKREAPRRSDRGALILSMTQPVTATAH